MKVAVSFLAFLIIIFSAIPFMLTSCKKEDINDANKIITVYDKQSNQIIKLDLEDYLIGVVSGEMPAHFSLNALMAQSVAARTYALRKVNKSLSEHKGADLCTDFAHCQAYIDNEKAKLNWGKSYEKNLKKIKSAVNETKGEYLEYNNDFAITVFHSCSNGITEKASEVWGGNIPYLVSVESPGDYIKKDYITKSEFTEKDFKEKLENYLKKDIDFSKEAIGEISYTSGSNVAQICLFGQNFKGTDIRTIFSLKSSSFSIEKNNDKYIFTATGSGHGVGMSQYGAEKMAQDNISYKKILSHYYPGTKLKKAYN